MLERHDCMQPRIWRSTSDENTWERVFSGGSRATRRERENVPEFVRSWAQEWPGSGSEGAREAIARRIMFTDELIPSSNGPFRAEAMRREQKIPNAVDRRQRKRPKSGVRSSSSGTASSSS